MSLCRYHVTNRPLTILGLLAAMIVLSSSARAAIINVPADFATIQAAIADARTVNGDEIIVAPGTYLEAINFLGKAITVRSSSGAAVTIIDGGGVEFHVVQCVSGETSATVLDGFTITGGNATGANPDDRGGGMFNFGSSNPTVTNCTFSGNMATFGGGMFNQSSSPTLTNCMFSGNTATTSGGGMYNFTASSPTLSNCTFSDNRRGTRRRDGQRQQQSDGDRVLVQRELGQFWRRDVQL